LFAVCVVAAAGMVLAGCQNQGSGGAVQLPERIVVWEDPVTGATGSSIRDANNDAERIVLVGTDGRVQFVSDQSVCNDCMTEGATIDLGGGNLIDIRFGVGAVGDDVRRPFLVDRASGNFVQLVGGGDEEVTFQVTTEPFEDPNDDLAIAAGETDNPTLGTGGGGGSGGLCGALGLGTILPIGLGLMILMAWRRR
jgi:hypothetical protein